MAQARRASNAAGQRVTRTRRLTTASAKDKLVELGADYSKAAEPWGSHVVVDRNVYTGQNPQSSEELAKRIVSDLG